MEFSSKAIRGLKLSAIRELRKVAASCNFSFCIAHRLKPIYIAFLATSLPVIEVHHAFGDYQRRSRGLFVSLFRKRLTLFGVSSAARDYTLGCLPKLSSGCIGTFYNCIDVAGVQAGQLSRTQARGSSVYGFIVGNVERLHTDKDHSTLIRVFARALPDSQLVSLGGGRLEQIFKELASELGVGEQVKLLGQMPNARRYFYGFDVFALSSTHKPFSMVLPEAMAVGVPLLATAYVGIREVVESLEISFPIGDAEYLAQVLQYHVLLADAQHLACAELVLARLQERFSDQAVRDTFWHLSQAIDLTVKS